MLFRSKNNTIGSTKWQWVPPTDPTPIADSGTVPGDDVQPAWSARLLDLLELDGHVLTVKGDTVNHMLTMFSPETLSTIGNVLGVGTDVLPYIKPAIAMPDEAASFFVSLQSQFHERPRTKTDKKRLRKYLAQFDNKTLQRIMRRAVISLVQHPGPVTPRQPESQE